MRIGSQEHKELFCRWFMDTHNVYEPVDLPWPDLDEGAARVALGVARTAGRFRRARKEPGTSESVA